MKKKNYLIIYVLSEAGVRSIASGNVLGSPVEEGALPPAVASLDLELDSRFHCRLEFRVVVGNRGVGSSRGRRGAGWGRHICWS